MNHSHVLYDSDPHFKIDPISRKITNESSSKTTIIQHDHNSERFTFECPRYVEGHDLSLCNIVEIHYVNIESNTKIVRGGVYSVDDLQIKSDDENSVVCSWLVPNNATQFVGQLQFLVRFSCASEDTGKIEYVWNTAIYSGISVSTGIYNAESPSDNPVPPFNFVTTIDGQVLKFFVGTQAAYNALSAEDKEGLFAIISDDKTKEEIFEAIKTLQTDVGELKNGIESGAVVAEKATHATNADRATHATTADKATMADMLAYGWTNKNIKNGVIELASSNDGETYMCLIDVAGYRFMSIIRCDDLDNTTCVGTFCELGNRKAYVTYEQRNRKITAEATDANGSWLTYPSVQIVSYCRIM